MKSPYPWFGGKASVADDVWDRFGDVVNYVEPFFGGGAVLLARPKHHAATMETVNDINAWLTNFWRSVKADPDGVAYHAADPVSELDLHARGDWLFYRPGVDRDFVERVRSDPDWYCVKSAGWWVWGQCAWICGGWGRMERGSVNRQRPHLSNGGQGINRQRPRLGSGGRGDGVTDTTRLAVIRQYMRELCERTSYVRVCCGDWLRVCGSDSTTTIHGTCGVFLDPPYAVVDRDNRCYGENDDVDVAHAVRDWAIAAGANPLMRIALCGYDEHDERMPDGWRAKRWTAKGGYSGTGDGQGKVNRARETIWFSPACIDVEPLLWS